MRSVQLLAFVVFALLSPAAVAAPSRAARGAALREGAPVDGRVELGAYAGVLVPADDHGFFAAQWRPLAAATGSLGVRIGHYPLRWIGFEGEAGLLPGRTRDGRYFNGFAVRGHAVFQLPLRIAPFLLGGVGVLGVRTPASVLGSDIDPALHVGAGLKFHALDWLAVRLEWRGTVAGGRSGADGLVLHNEVLLGLSFAFARKDGSARR